jgi:drug/metabolite transporter (DMT)-like permease
VSGPFVPTLLALVAFAGNSVLCRLALGEGAIDAASFTTIRFASGAATLLLVSQQSRERVWRGARGDWRAAAILVVYAVPFAFAYVTLDAGTGALILFGTVQVTMLAAAVLSGERPTPLQWMGLFAALGGLIYLVSPGLLAPSPAGSALMAVSGMAWGLYSLHGRHAGDPIRSNAANFVRALPVLLATSIISWPSLWLSTRGVVLAVVAGAVTTGLGYVVWYRALRELTATRASVVQLSVPLLAALGGVALMGERVSWRLLVSSALILGGVALAVARHRSRAAPATAPGSGPDRSADRCSRAAPAHRRDG